MKQIIAPRAVLTADPETREVRCTSGQAVVIDGETILAVGDARTLIEDHPAIPIQRFDHSILTPGFVNGHHHIGVTPVQMGVRDSNLETWVSLRAVSPALELGLDTTYSAAQMLRSGVTTVQHLQGWQPSDVDDPTAAARTVLDTYGKIGMRASYAKLVRDQNYFVHGNDDDLLAGLPTRHHDRFTQLMSTFNVTVEDQLKAFTTLRSAYADDHQLTVQLAPANFHWVSDEVLEAFGEISASTGAPIHMHLLESPYQSAYMDRRAGAERVRYLNRSGVLSERLTLGHGTWLQAADIEALAEVGASVCNNCSSNFRLSSGRLPLIDLLAAGVNVGIGIDEAGLNDDRDMIQEMRLIYTVNREPGLTRRRVKAEEVFTMATLGGARTTDFGHLHGSIVAGAPADLVIFDENVLRAPFQLEGLSEVELILQRARTDAITHVMVGGSWLLVDSQLTTIDEAALNEDLVSACAEVDLAKLRADQEFSERLTDAVRMWFIKAYDAEDDK